jgi:hypothetical protein
MKSWIENTFGRPRHRQEHIFKLHTKKFPQQRWQCRSRLDCANIFQCSLNFTCRVLRFKAYARVIKRQGDNNNVRFEVSIQLILRHVIWYVNLSRKFIKSRRAEEEKQPSSSTLADEAGTFFPNVGNQQLQQRNNTERSRTSIVYITNDEIEFSAVITLVKSAYDYSFYSKVTPWSGKWIYLYLRCRHFLKYIRQKKPSFIARQPLSVTCLLTVYEVFIFF